MKIQIMLSLAVTLLFFSSCKATNKKTKLESPPAKATRSVNTGSDEIPPKLGAALLQLAYTLKSFKPPPADTSPLSTPRSSTPNKSTDDELAQRQLKTINLLAKNASEIDVNTLYTFFQSPAFAQLKIDYRAGTSNNLPTKSPQSLALAESTDSSSNSSTAPNKVNISEPSTWFNWVGTTTSDHKEQLTLMGAAFFLTVAVVNIAFVKFDYHKATQLLVNRRFFASAVCFAVLADIGVAVTDLGLMYAGISGKMEKKTFEEIEGASLVIGGGAMALMGVVGLGSLMDGNKIKTDTEYVKKMVSEKPISDKVPISKLNATRIGLGVFLGFGVLSAAYGGYKITHAQSLDLVDSDPNANFFPQLTKDFTALFAIHDEMHPG